MERKKVNLPLSLELDNILNVAYSQACSHITSCPATIMSDSPSRTREITVLYFAAASTATNLTSERVPIPEAFLLSSLGQLLVTRHPNTNLGKVLEGSQWSVHEEMVDDPQTVELKGGEEVAVICPVSGG